ncbi:MAG: cyclic nucleotide-binding domain-containing protein [Ardenticatenaceae bacterium]|nr:cyclic nucleotide-binding domain-containing protein [Ardenticatenaceae bacterium]
MATVDMFKFVKNTVEIEAGHELFHEGDAADFMYVVQHGELDIRVSDTVVEVVREGGVIGEMALVDPSPRSATVVAKTDCILVPFDEASFKTHVHTTPFFALQVMRVMVNRLRQMNELVGQP